MEQKILLANHDKVMRQRNMLLGISALMMVSNVFLSLKVASQDSKVIMVPGLGAEMAVSSKQISQGYLQEMANMFLSLLLDLAPNDIGYKKDKVLKYTTAKGLRNIEKYFTDEAERLKKFKLSTYFTPKELIVDEKNLRVKAFGILTSHFGASGNQDQEITCLLQFVYTGGILRLESFNIAQGKN
jgi:type IV conjugative transfer system protein TraE